MPSIIRFLNGQTPQQVTEFRNSVDPALYQGQPDIKVYTDTSNPTEVDVKALVDANPLRYLKVVGEAVEVMTLAEKNAVDAAIAAALLAAQRSGAKNLFDSAAQEGKILKALILVLIDEINALRTRDRDRAVDVSNSTSLADLKTRWAAQSSLSDRTAAQARTAIRNHIDNGDSD